MPRVGKKHFSYGKKGVAAAKRYSKTVGKKVTRGKKRTKGK